jgi:hypothetical protein
MFWKRFSKVNEYLFVFLLTFIIKLKLILSIYYFNLSLADEYKSN